MKKIFFFVFTFYSFLVSGQITIDETLTAQELVEDVLINSPCAEVSDIGQRTGTDFGNVNGIASFDANGSDFPFTTGIVLMSGDVSLAPGPNTSLDLSHPINYGFYKNNLSIFRQNTFNIKVNES